MRPTPTIHPRRTLFGPGNITPRRLVALLIASASLLDPARADTPTFSRDILPILSENCFLCHGPDAGTRKANLRLDIQESALRTKDPVISPRKSAESELFHRVVTTDAEELMPPPKSGKKLSPQQVDLLKNWIDSGARWGKHWAFETPQRPTPPPVADPRFATNPIDRFIAARLASADINLKPSPGAPRSTLARRLSLDLTGLPPSAHDLQTFLSDQSPAAYEHFVDRLLASPHYGERMAMDWLDGARYADTNGFQNDFARTMWPWRDWVISAFNRNLSFDRFITDQIAGDLLPTPTLQERIATGFNRNNRTVTEAGSIEEEYRIENAVDRVETTTTVFLGLTMGCARCHDHKYDPVSQAEFYQFVGFFSSINEKGVYTETRGNVAPLISLPTDRDRKRLTEIDAAIAKAKESKAKDQKTQVDKLTKQKADYEKTITSVMVMEEMPKPRDTFVLKRGQYDQPDLARKVDPGPPACLTPLPKGAARNRLGLARWLTAPDNPLTARVAVNRVWQHHFGTGLVKTAENFGIQGDTPSHPELLDWLATEFVRTGWDVKQLHRLIVTSATYRQASAVSPSLLVRDPENRLLARGPRFRLPAEIVRDNALAIAGLLSSSIGGPSIKPYQPAGLWEELAGGAGEGPYVQDKGDKLYRRSLYVYRKRTVPHPLMATFDAPSREICQVKRPRTNTPLQALELLNDVTYVEAARHLGQLMLAEGGTNPNDRIAYAVRRALSRPPAPHELTILRRGLDRYLAEFRADRASATQLIHQGESPSDPSADTAELAAYTATASVILNLDETITVE